MKLTICRSYKGNTWQLEFDDSGQLEFLHVSIVQKYSLQEGIDIPPSAWKEIQLQETCRKAYQRGRYLLDEREYGYVEMHRKLTEKYGQKVASMVTKALAKSGFIDDRRYALQLAEHYMVNKRFGSRRAYQEMRRRGLLEPQILAAIEQFEDYAIDNLDALIHGKFQKYFVDFKDYPMIEKGKAALARQGYPYGAIKEAVTLAKEQWEEQEHE